MGRTFQENLKQGVTISLLVHLLFLSLILFVLPKINFNLNTDSEKSGPKILEVVDLKDVAKSEIQKLRTVGLPEGKKEEFTLPIFEKKPVKNQEFKQNTPTLSDLGSTQRKVQKENEMMKRKEEKTAKVMHEKMRNEIQDENADEVSYHSTNPRIEKLTNAEMVKVREEANFGPPSKLPQTSIAEVASSPMDEYLLNKSAFNFKMSPPRGVPLDQLNSAERIFYTFNKRTFETYLNSFISTYRQIATNHPQVQGKLSRDLHKMVGKIIFDREGNIVTIKMVKWSNDDMVQKLFEDTLSNIHALPNPPKALLDDRGEFYIYFQLNIGE